MKRRPARAKIIAVLLETLMVIFHSLNHRKVQRNSWLAWELLALQEGFSAIELDRNWTCIFCEVATHVELLERHTKLANRLETLKAANGVERLVFKCSNFICQVSASHSHDKNIRD
jgi:hypothetical protein